MQAVENIVSLSFGLRTVNFYSLVMLLVRFETNDISLEFENESE